MCLYIMTVSLVYSEGKEDSNSSTSKGASSVYRFKKPQSECKVHLEQQRLQEEDVESQ